MGTHNCWIEMMYLFFLLFLLGHRVQGQKETCWQDPCDPEDIKGKGTASKADNIDECQQQCLDLGEKCKWFDFGGLHHDGDKNCLLLEAKCKTKSSHNDGHSGPPNCETDPTPTCAFTQGALQWQCFDDNGDGLEDSLKKLPLGSSCTTECYGNRYTSKCVEGKQGGEWGDLESTADGDDQDHIDKIKRPDLEGDNRGKCECDPITLKKKTQ